MLEYHKQIKQFREMRNFTQEYMAEELGLSQRSYSSIENGQTQLTVERLFEIAKTLQVNVIGVENQSVYHNNFNNHAVQNKGNLIFNQDYFEAQKQLFERIIVTKDEEIQFLKTLISK